MSSLKYILTIAGHDPSGGAGITSDIKTFEAHGLYGLSVCTAITVQNDIDFKECIWTSAAVIITQIEVLFTRFTINVVKIGIIENWEILVLIIERLHTLNNTIKVVLDPIFKASVGFNFHIKEPQNLLETIWRKCFIITPNYEEIQLLYPNLTIQETITHIQRYTNVYLKGGHRKGKKGIDELFLKNGKNICVAPVAKSVSEKHGSGCVFSSSLSSNLALDHTLQKACKLSKVYIEEFLNSNTSLLGEHKKYTYDD